MRNVNQNYETISLSGFQLLLHAHAQYVKEIRAVAFDRIFNEEYFFDCDKRAKLISPTRITSGTREGTIIRIGGGTKMLCDIPRNGADWANGDPAATHGNLITEFQRELSRPGFTTFSLSLFLYARERERL